MYGTELQYLHFWYCAIDRDYFAMVILFEIPDHFGNYLKFPYVYESFSIIKGTLYTIIRFSAMFLKGRQLLRLPIGFSAH